MFRNLYFLAAAAVCSSMLSSSAAAASSVSFSEVTQSYFLNTHADFNNDGREDYLVPGTVCSNGFGLVLSTGDGSFAAPQCFTKGGYSFAVGDFNGDGNADLATYDGASTIYVYFGSATGKLTLGPASTVSGPVLYDLKAADFNHDGKIDLIYTTSTDNNLHVLLGNGNGTFSTGSLTPVAAPGYLSIGDFDGDGKADVVSQYSFYTTQIQVFYGDGAGHFTATAPFTDDTGYTPFDVNGDGRMDLIGEPFDSYVGGSKYYNEVRVMYGNANRTFTTVNIPLANCQNGGVPAVADYNGDGIPDIAVVENSDCSGDGPETVNILAGNGDGTYQPEQLIYTDSTDHINPLSNVRQNHDTASDLTAFAYTSNFLSAPAYLFFNQTTGNFPACDAPDRYTGFSICSPSSSVVPSGSVSFSVGAANQTQGRKVEVWVDGKKLDEQLKGAFSYYSFLDTSLSLSNGKHNVTIFSAGWDNLLESYSFPLNVGSTTCPVPSSAGLDVCSPLPSSNVTSPVLAWASGTVTGTIARMEVWVDGVKKYSTYGENTLKTNITLGSGQHTFTYYIVNTAGQKWSQTETVTVR